MKPVKMVFDSIPQPDSWVEKMFVGIDSSDRPDETVTFEWPPCQAFATSEQRETAIADRARDITPPEESE